MSPSQVSYVPLDAGAAMKAEGVSVSTVAATVVGTGHHMLEIEGYSLLKRTHWESGRFIESSRFKVGGHTWRIRCYLNGKTKENAGFVSLYLYVCCNGTGPAVHAEYEFALVPHQGTPPVYGVQDGTLPVYGLQESTPSKASQGVRTFRQKGHWKGFPKFISVEELECSRFLKDDCLAVRCTVTVVRERAVKEKTVTPHDLVRLGMLCKCDDDLCKRNHARPAVTFLERFAKLGRYFCRAPGRTLE